MSARLLASVTETRLVAETGGRKASRSGNGRPSIVDVFISVVAAWYVLIQASVAARFISIHMYANIYSLRPSVLGVTGRWAPTYA